MTKVPIRSKFLTDYWFEFYATESGLCSLCGNRGTIDTTGVTSPAGVPAGRKNFCICPNGQTIRYYSKQKDKKKCPITP